MKYYMIIEGEIKRNEKRPEPCLLKSIPIDENDIEQAELCSQLVNGIIDRMLEDMKRTKEE